MLTVDDMEGGLLLVQADGQLTAEGYFEFVARLEWFANRRMSPVRMLIVLRRDFDGWCLELLFDGLKLSRPAPLRSHGSSGCAPERAGDPDPERAGRRICARDGGSPLLVDFLAGGLSIELAPLPGGAPQRLTAPAVGLPFVGDGVTAYHSNGGLVLIGSEGPSRSCRPAPPAPERTPRPP